MYATKQTSARPVAVECAIVALISYQNQKFKARTKRLIDYYSNLIRLGIRLSPVFYRQVASRF